MAGTHSRLVIIGGILTIAIADALSDALGIHICEESENRQTAKGIWEATVYTFVFKFVFATTFVIPVLLLPLTMAIIVSIVWGLLSLGVLSFYIARERGATAWKVIAEHLAIALVVIAATNYVGAWIGSVFC